MMNRATITNSGSVKRHCLSITLHLNSPDSDLKDREIYGSREQLKMHLFFYADILYIQQLIMTV